MSKPIAASTLRIIGGFWRGRKVSFTPIDQLRPTPDRVRETLFNWLQGQVAGKCVLELFAGSGILSFEALSRGAKQAMLIDRSPKTVDQLRRSREQLGLTEAECLVQQEDAFTKITTPATDPFDLIFLDPPFQTDRYLELIALLKANNYLKAQSLIYVESPTAENLEAIGSKHLPMVKHKKAGQVHFGLFGHANGF